MSAEHFEPLVGWGSPVELEVRKRITISVATYAYEVADKPIMSDGSWDFLAAQINRRIGTCHPLLDEFFLVEFSPMTGMWIHNHPELTGIKRIFDHYYGVMRDYFDQPGVQRLVRH